MYVVNKLKGFYGHKDSTHHLVAVATTNRKETQDVIHFIFIIAHMNFRYTRIT